MRRVSSGRLFQRGRVGVSKVGLDWCVHPVVAVPLVLPITQSMPNQLAQIWAYCNTGIHTPFKNPVLVYTYVGKVCLCFSKFLAC